jgi:hypothetical protein
MRISMHPATPVRIISAVVPGFAGRVGKRRIGRGHANDRSEYQPLARRSTCGYALARIMRESIKPFLGIIKLVNKYMNKEGAIFDLGKRLSYMTISLQSRL